MAIQMRRGLKADFDPQKMLPGEWAVSIDSETSNQIVWMCFHAGVVKRMGTYEDFKAQIEEATDDIRELYEETFNEIKAYMEGLADEAEEYKDTAVSKAQEASGSADVAAANAAVASQKAEAASVSADEASSSADESENFRKLSESYAHGGTGVRPNENVDSSQYYYEQAKRISQGLEGALLPMGTIAYTQLPAVTRQAGYMYNIMDDFTTDNTFKEGAGYTYPAGTNVYYTADGYWDCLSGTLVAGVKGSAENIYRRGFVEITKSNIGLGNVENKSSVTIRNEITSSNVKNALGYTPLSTTGNVASATKLKYSRLIDGISFDGSSNVTHFAVCDTNPTSSEKYVHIQGIEIVEGARAIVQFKHGNEVNGISLWINDNSTGVIYCKKTPVGTFPVGSIFEMVFADSHWNIVGEINTSEIDQIYTKLNPLISPVALYSSTLYASALNTWVYASIPSLKYWKEVRMWLEVGDAECRYNTLTREHMQICVSGYANANYNGLVRVSCDFTNARIGLLVRSMTGWGFSNIRITRVEGVVKV